MNVRKENKSVINDSEKKVQEALMNVRIVILSQANMLRLLRDTDHIVLENMPVILDSLHNSLPPTPPPPPAFWSLQTKGCPLFPPGPS